MFVLSYSIRDNISLKQRFPFDTWYSITLIYENVFKMHRGNIYLNFCVEAHTHASHGFSEISVLYMFWEEGKRVYSAA